MESKILRVLGAICAALGALMTFPISITVWSASSNADLPAEMVDLARGQAKIAQSEFGLTVIILGAVLYGAGAIVAAIGRRSAVSDLQRDN